MWQNVSYHSKRYLYFYRDFVADSWREITPPQYGMLLIAIAVIGWLLMRSHPHS